MIKVIYILKQVLLSLLIPLLEKGIKKVADYLKEIKSAETTSESNTETGEQKIPCTDTTTGMTILQFVEKFTGVPISFWNNGSVQCVDVVRAFIRDVLQLPQPEPLGADGSAVWFFTRHDTRPIQMQHFDRITFQPGMTPPPGALIIFDSSSSNEHGHIGICLEANENIIRLFDQDGVVNSAALRAGRPQTGAGQSSWNYDRVLGWLQVRAA